MTPLLFPYSTMPGSDKAQDVSSRVFNQVQDTARNHRGSPDDSLYHTSQEFIFLYDLLTNHYGISSMPDGAALQLGIFCGASACVLGLANRDSKSPFKSVVAVEPFYKMDIDGPIEIIDYAYVEARENMIRLGLDKQELTLVVQWDVDFINDIWRLPIRCALVDSSHFYEQTIDEIQALLPYIAENGFMLFHDYFNKDTPGSEWAVRGAIHDSFNRYDDRDVYLYVDADITDSCESGVLPPNGFAIIRFDNPL